MIFGERPKGKTLIYDRLMTNDYDIQGRDFMNIFMVFNYS